MPELIRVQKSSPATTFIMGADLLRQDPARNLSVIRIYLQAFNGPGGSSSSNYNGYGQQQGHIEGLVHFGTVEGNPFLPSGVPNGGNRWTRYYDVEIGHGADGTRGPVTLRMYLGYGNVNENHYATFSDFPRIPKVPGTPVIDTVNNVTTNSARVYCSVPDNMGSSIVEFQFQAATNREFTAGVVTSNNAGQVHDVPGLTPGQAYYFRARVRNGVGWGGWSAPSGAVFVGLPAPTFDSWTQDATGGLVGTWRPPSVATGLTGYRVQIARNAEFTQGVQSFDVGNVLTATIADLAGGRIWHARIAARTAGGVNAYSASRSVMLVIDAGDLDGWTRVGVKPPAVNYYTAQGIRRGTVAGKQALVVESLTTAAVTMEAGSAGIQRTVGPLEIGKAYRFQARATLTGLPAATAYRLVVVGETSAAPVIVGTSSTDLGYVEFVADVTHVTLRIMLAETLTPFMPLDELERVAFHDVKLLQLVTDYPVRLRETVYESNLANHFDLACNSVGASWYVGKDGVTRFRLPGTALPVSAVFSDKADAGALHYTDVDAAYDTRSMVNRLDVTNYGVDAARENEENDDLVAVDAGSAAAYGTRSARLEVNLYDLPPYDESLTARLDTLLAGAAEPRLFISSFKWNAQEDLAAANALDVGQRITVRFNGTEQDSQIVALTHEITPRRWIVTVTLRRL